MGVDFNKKILVDLSLLTSMITEYLTKASKELKTFTGFHQWIWTLNFTVPTSLVLVRDQARREAVKQGGKGAMLLKKSNFTKLHSPLNTSRTSSDAAREEMMAMVY